MSGPRTGGSDMWQRRLQQFLGSSRAAWLGIVISILILGSLCVPPLLRGGKQASGQRPSVAGSTVLGSEGEARPMATVLELHCTNASAKVFLDRQYKGTTPLVLPWRVVSEETRTFAVSLRADGFESHDEEVQMRPGEWHTVEVALTPRKAPSGEVVCIDPGHPSEVNSGLTVQHGTTENHINWVVGVELRKRLEDAGLKVVMTKQREDEHVTNRRRAEIANGAGAKLMVRLHCDTAADPSANGCTLYYPDHAGRKGDDVGPSANVREGSRRAAELLHGSLIAGLKGVLRDNGIATDAQTAVGSRQGALTGSIYSRVPVVTVEMVFLSSRKDADFIKSEDGQRRMARALADGVVRFVRGRALEAEAA